MAGNVLDFEGSKSKKGNQDKNNHPSLGEGVFGLRKERLGSREEQGPDYNSAESPGGVSANVNPEARGANLQEVNPQLAPEEDAIRETREILQTLGLDPSSSPQELLIKLMNAMGDSSEVTAERVNTAVNTIRQNPNAFGKPVSETEEHDLKLAA